MREISDSTSSDFDLPMNYGSAIRDYKKLVEEYKSLVRGPKDIWLPNSKHPLNEYILSLEKSLVSGKSLDFETNWGRLGMFVKHLKIVQKHEPVIFREMRIKLRKCRDRPTFHGIRFEVNILASLIDRSIKFFKSERPDFLIRFSEANLKLEVTSCRSSKGIFKNYTKKIVSTIRKKASHGYSSMESVLFIDITNLFNLSGYRSSLTNFNSRAFKKRIHNIKDYSPFGSIVLFCSFYRGDLQRFEQAYVRHDNQDISSELKEFLTLYWPKEENKAYEIMKPDEG